VERSKATGGAIDAAATEFMEPSNVNMQQWSQLIGAFLINFGAAEIATFQWIERFSSAKVRNESIDLILSKRIALVRQLVEQSNLPDDRKTRALDLWGQVSELSKKRNIIAHNPLISHTKDGKTDIGFINTKKMRGVGPYAIEPLLFVEIAREGSRLAKILPEIIHHSYETAEQACFRRLSGFCGMSATN
jgi:hypothetical protein